MSTFNSGILDNLLNSPDDYHQRIPNQQNSDYFSMFEKIFGLSCDRASDIIRDKSNIDELNK